MKKVNELDGAGLDYWVAKGEGLDKPTEQQQRDHLYLKIIGESCYLPSGGAYRPSSDWSQAGPIIDRGEVTDISPAKNGRSGWEATACGLGYHDQATTLIAGLVFSRVQVRIEPAAQIELVFSRAQVRAQLAATVICPHDRSGLVTAKRP